MSPLFRFLHYTLEFLGVIPVHLNLSKKLFLANLPLLIYCCCAYLIRQFSCFGIWVCQSETVTGGTRDAGDDSYFVTNILYLIDMTVFVSTTLFININYFANRGHLQDLLVTIFNNGQKLKQLWHQDFKASNISFSALFLVTAELGRLGLELMTVWQNNGDDQCNNIASLAVTLNLITQRLIILYETFLIILIHHQMQTVQFEIRKGGHIEETFVMYDRVMGSLEDFQSIFGWVLFMRVLTAFSSFMMLFYLLLDAADGDVSLDWKHTWTLLDRVFIFFPNIIIFIFFWHLGLLVDEVRNAGFFWFCLQ